MSKKYVHLVERRIETELSGWTSYAIDEAYSSRPKADYHVAIVKLSDRHSFISLGGGYHGVRGRDENGRLVEYRISTVEVK